MMYGQANYGLKQNVIHLTCGKVAFYLTHRLHDGEVANSSNVILLDGTIPKDGDPAVCGSCGGLIEDFTKNYIRNEDRLPS
jgi:hypothetical protein